MLCRVFLTSIVNLRVPLLQHSAATRQKSRRLSEAGPGHQILVWDRTPQFAALTSVRICHAPFVEVSCTATLSSVEAVQRRPGFTSDRGEHTCETWDYRYRRRHRLVWSGADVNPTAVKTRSLQHAQSRRMRKLNCLSLTTRYGCARCVCVEMNKLSHSRQVATLSPTFGAQRLLL